MSTNIGLPNVTEGNVVQVTQLLVELVRKLQGGGDASTKVPTVADLQAAGVLITDQNGTLKVAGSNVVPTTVGAAGTVGAVGVLPALARGDHSHPIYPPSVLTPPQKLFVLSDYERLVNDRTNLNTLADNFGVTTEKTTYNNAFDALIAYLATLTTPVLWSSLDGNTTLT